MEPSTYLGARMRYVSEVVDPVVEDLVHDMLTALPPDPVEYTISWMQARSGSSRSEPRRLSLLAENRQLRQSLKAMSSLVTEIGATVESEAAPKASTVENDDDSSEEDDDDDDVDEIPPPAFQRGPRASVSAEAYGAWNQVQNAEVPVYQKTSEQKTRLQTVLSLSFLFSALEDQDLNIILDAVEEKVFNDECIIKEGDDGDCLYVVDSGVLECKKVIGGEDKVVKVCGKGDVFGELALLYNCPRAASVYSSGTSTCWRLDRSTFNQVVKQAHMKRGERYDEFVKMFRSFLHLIRPNAHAS